ncbi:NAD(P)-binding protein [Xylariaceae sp. FL1651]|nr:NAD(P)-binding protein [Xylariaceae sp. FL1651]
MSSSANAPPRPLPKTVLVTGAGGYIGFAVSRAFVRAGWDVFGLIRRAEGADALLTEEITPLIGAIGPDLAFLDNFLTKPSTPPFDVIVSCTEQIPFGEHWQHVSALLTKVANHYHAKNSGGRPLVLMSSGCKDYGQTARHGDPRLAPHCETSPLDPKEILVARTTCTLKVFEQHNRDLYDAAVIRPTPLFGYGGSYYGVLFEALGRLQTQTQIQGTDVEKDGEGHGAQVRVPGHPDNIYHGCHIDDCADAYVALATYPVRSQVNGESFNISGYRYETVGEILLALAAEYGIRGAITTAPLKEISNPELRALEAMLGYTQWVDSTKIRKLTGWTDKRKLFSENVRTYRLAYEAAARAGDAGIKRFSDRVAGWAAAGLSFERK